MHFSFTQQISVLKQNEHYSLTCLQRGHRVCFGTQTCDHKAAEGQHNVTYFLCRYVEQRAFIKMLNDTAM